MTTRTPTADDRGQLLIITAFAMTAMLGIAALSIDAAYLYDKRNTLYAAADAAAKSAAFAKQRNPGADLRAFGEHELTLMGLTPVVSCGASGGTSLCVFSPPTVGAFAGNGKYVEAIVSQQSTGTFFGKVLGWMSANPGARAVAGLSNPSSCVTFNGSVSIGNFSMTLDGCGLSIGGSLTGTNPNSRIQDLAGNTNTVPVNVVQTCSGYCGKMGELHEHAAAPYDSLAATLTAPTAPDPATCVPGLTPTIGPGCYSNISAAVQTLLPGDYYITGTVNIDSLSGDDVFLYLTGLGRFNVVGQNKLLHLTAHTSGPYQGIVVWQNIADTWPFSCLSCPPAGNPFPPNNFTLSFDGAIYMPGVDQEFRNSLSITPSSCSLFIARNFTVNNGAGTLTNVGCANLYGGAGFLSVAVAE